MTKGFPDWTKLTGIKKEVPYKIITDGNVDVAVEGTTPSEYEKTGISGWLREYIFSMWGVAAEWNTVTIEVYKDGETSAFQTYSTLDIFGGVTQGQNFQMLGDYVSLFQYSPEQMMLAGRFRLNTRFETGFKLKWYGSALTPRVDIYGVLTWEQEIV